MPRQFDNNSVLEVAFVGEHQGQRTLNLLHYRFADVVDGPRDWTTIDDDFMDVIQGLGGLQSTYLDCCSEEFTLLTIRTQILNPSRWSYIDHAIVGGEGQVVAPALPPNDGVTITKRNNGTGRTNRGAVHMPAVPTTFIADAEITSAALLAYENFGDVLVEELQLPQLPAPPMRLQPCIFHRADPTVSPTTTEYIVQRTSRVNRRRTKGVGE